MRHLAAVLILLISGASAHAEPLTATATIRGDDPGRTITRHLYGHFAEHLGRCIYDGIWVGADSPIPNDDGLRTDVVQALKKVGAPNLRWPGGCFADDYHWRDGIGPRDERPNRVNIHWGQVVENNSFGTHEFMRLCEGLGAEPYIAGNVGSGSPQEMRDWIEYMTFDGDSTLANLRRENGREEPWKVRFWGVGNENWGCGGNMTPGYYADLFKRYATFCINFSGNRLERVACGPGSRDPNWTRTVMRDAAGRMQGISVHHYSVAAPWNDKLPATGFGERDWFGILKHGLEMEEILVETEVIMDEFDRRGRVGIFVDEWGSWYQTEEGYPGYSLFQQNSLRDALLAAQTLHIFHNHLQRVRMANIAQTVNVLQAMILTDGEKMLLTPTYHAFEMMRVHHDAARLPVDLQTPDYMFEGDSIPALSVEASRAENGEVHLSIVNTHASDAVQLTCDLQGVDASKVIGRVLTSDRLDAHNTFDAPEQLAPNQFDGAELADGKLTVDVPAHSLVVLQLAE